MDYLSRTRLCGDHGFGRRIPRRPAPFARPGRPSGSVVRDGFLSIDPADCDLSNGPRVNGVNDVAARKFLRFSIDTSRHHRRCRPALPSVRKVLPHLPTTGPTRNKAISGGRRFRPGHALHSVRRAVCFANAHRRFEDGALPTGIRLQVRGCSNVAGCLSFMQTKIPGDEPIALKKGFPWHGRRLMKPRL